MLVTLGGRVISRKYLQLLKAPFPMFVTLEGSAIPCKSSHHKKA